MNPSPLTGERLAHLFFINPNQCVLQFVPASGSYGDSGPHHDCGFAYRLRSIRLLVHFLTLQKRKSPTVLSAGLETKALTHRWDKINTDSGKVNSPQQNRRLSLQALPRYLLKLFFCPCLFNIEFRNQLIIERFNGLLPRIQADYIRNLATSCVGLS